MDQLFLIANIYLDPDQIVQLKSLGFELLWPRPMTEKILAWDGWREFDPEKTLIVIPGGACTRLVPFLPATWLQGWNSCRIHACRFWVPGQDPVAVAGRIHLAMILGLHHVMILDDVVSSGSTIRKIREVNAPWIPNAKWHVVSWIRQAVANTKGFCRINAAVIVGNPPKKSPVNSLSNLLGDSIMAESYASRKLGSAKNDFLTLLSQIRGRP